MFQYKGGTDSLTYRHLWSPFAEKLLHLTPSHMAPNAITFAGFLLLLTTHILFVWDRAEATPVASWKLVLMFTSIMVYQQLDNLDGKQARKTSHHQYK